MRILVLTKRQYTAKDLLGDCYGRMFEIPAAMAALGHDVRGIALSYRMRDEGWRHCDGVSGVSWRSINALPMGFSHYATNFAEMIKEWSPDVLWASSDALHAVLGARLSRRHGIPLVIDLYDNYESFGLTHLPGVRYLFRRACRDANGLTVVSNALRRYVVETCHPVGLQQVVGNGVRKDVFSRQDRLACRQALNLPADARLIGTAGALTRERGIGDLFDAFVALAVNDSNLWLVYAGPRDGALACRSHPRVIDLVVLPWQRVPMLLSALDVAVICNRDSAFGRYCFPLKLHESIACGAPVVAAAVGDVVEVLAATPDALYQPGNVKALASAISKQLQKPVLLSPCAVPSWCDLGARVGTFLERVVEAGKPSQAPSRTGAALSR
jgi:glycosyltransferase involved in cell wall biosynthesis